ncbi:MAG: hypothetical protein HDS91_00655 [Bacteroidales bacterium]|nr:hypothetical protein [Bacteroidales bacterium]
MAQITILKDNEGKILYPITSSKAVLDENGIDLETKFNTLPAFDKIVKTEGDQTVAGVLTVKGVKVPNGTNKQFFKANGDIDDTEYLDKTVYDNEHTQLTSFGWYDKETNQFYAGQNYKNSGAIPLNRSCSIEYYGLTGGRAASITFLDISKNPIHSIQFPDSGQHIINPDEFPENAAFFVAASYINYNCYYKNGDTIESLKNTFGQLIQEAKKLLFIDMWNEACGEYGQYNVDTGAFELNGLTDITYEQALAIMDAGKRQSSTGVAGYIENVKIRTNLPRIGRAQAFNGDSMFYLCRNLEVASCRNMSVSSASFAGCSKLKRVNEWVYDLNAYIPTSSLSYYPFKGCEELEYIIGSIRSNNDIYIHESPKIRVECLRYWLNNAYNTSSIRIFVHPDVYAKLTNTEVLDYVPNNLLVGSDILIENSYSGSYLLGYMNLGGISPKQGDKITITVWGELGEGKNYFAAYNSGSTSSARLLEMHKTGDGVYSGIGTWRDFGANSFLILYAFPNTVTNPSRIDKVKLEFGENTNPVWTPAIEEIEDPELREKVQWASLLYQAAAKNIQFATIE